MVGAAAESVSGRIGVQPASDAVAQQSINAAVRRRTALQADEAAGKLPVLLIGRGFMMMQEGAHPHPRCAGASNFGKQDAARRVLTLLDGEANPFISWLSDPESCPVMCLDATIDDTCEDCLGNDRVELRIDLLGLRAALDLRSPSAHYDTLTVDLAASLLGEGSVNVGLLLDAWKDGELEVLLSALAVWTDSPVVERWGALLL